MTPNAPLNAALEAAKAARPASAAQRQTPRPIWTGPTAEQPECPF